MTQSGSCVGRAPAQLLAAPRLWDEAKGVGRAFPLSPGHVALPSPSAQPRRCLAWRAGVASVDGTLLCLGDNGCWLPAAQGLVQRGRLLCPAPARLPNTDEEATS